VVRRIAESAVLSIGSQGVRLRLDREGFLRQPVYLPDEELATAVCESLRALAPFRFETRFLRALEVDARDGVARLFGHVAEEAHGREAVRRASTTPGVLWVEDDLVADERLVSAVALAMVPHRELQPSRVRIQADLGAVRLEGELDSARDVELAAALAASVPGVAAVESRLRTRQPGTPTSQAARAALWRPGRPGDLDQLIDDVRGGDELPVSGGPDLHLPSD
jgi:osmotically-inducible protein OsmY